MANICENTLYAASNYEDNLSYIYNYFIKSHSFYVQLYELCNHIHYVTAFS